MSDALYAEYLQERQGLTVMKRPFGFLAYKVEGKECFIAEMFIERAQRKSGEGRQLIAALQQIANACECEIITARIYLKDPNATKTIAAAISTGFEVKSAGHDVLLIAKEIKGAK